MAGYHLGWGEPQNMDPWKFMAGNHKKKTSIHPFKKNGWLSGSRDA